MRFGAEPMKRRWIWRLQELNSPVSTLMNTVLIWLVRLLLNLMTRCAFWAAALTHLHAKRSSDR